MCKLREEVNSLIAKIEKTVDTTLLPSGAKTLSEEEIIHEILDRQNRTNNLIVHNMPEFTANSKDEAMREDRYILIIKAPHGISDRIIKNCIRLGKYSNGKTRLLQVVLESRFLADNALIWYK